MAELEKLLHRIQTETGHRSGWMWFISSVERARHWCLCSQGVRTPAEAQSVLEGQPQAPPPALPGSTVALPDGWLSVLDWAGEKQTSVTHSICAPHASPTPHSHRTVALMKPRIKTFAILYSAYIPPCSNDACEQNYGHQISDPIFEALVFNKRPAYWTPRQFFR